MLNPDDLESPAEIYHRYFGPALFGPWPERLVAMAPPAKGQHILDLACGTGIVTEQIALAGTAGTISGLDPSAAMLDVARQRDFDGVKVEWREGAAESLPYDAGTFDSAYCQHGFQYFADPDICAREIHRVLKPGGQVAVSVWASAEEHPLYEAVFGSVSRRLDVPFEAVAKPLSFGGPSRLETVLESAGFSDVKVVSESLEATFPYPDSWLKLNVQGAAAAIPAFAELSEDERRAVIPGVISDVDSLYRQHVHGDSVTVPTRAHSATGVA